MKRTIVCLILIISLATGGSGVVAQTSPVHLTNGIWLDYRWVCDPDYQAADVARLLSDLERNGIRRVYLNCGSLTAEGKFRGEYLRHFEFLQMAREWGLQHGTMPISIEAWLNGNLDPDRGEAVAISRPGVRSEIARVCRELVNGAGTGTGFSGIHLDLEPARGGNSEFLQVFETLRAGDDPAVPADCNLSLAGHSISANTTWTWSPEYAAEVLKRVDELALMGYDSGRLSGAAYADWLGNQARKLLEIASRQPGKSILIGVPTYAFNEFCTAHYALAETLDQAIHGIHQIDPFQYPAFQGLCIFPWGETDAAEWEIWRTRWLGLAPQPLPAPPLTRKRLQDELDVIRAERKVIAHFRSQPASRLQDGYTEMILEDENAARREEELSTVLAGLPEDADPSVVESALLTVRRNGEKQKVNDLTRAEAGLQALPFWKFWSRAAAQRKVLAAARELVLAREELRAMETRQGTSGGKSLDVELEMESGGAVLLPPGVDATEARRQMERSWQILGRELQKRAPDDEAVTAAAREYQYWKSVWEILAAAPGKLR